LLDQAGCCEPKQEELLAIAKEMREGVTMMPPLTLAYARELIIEQER
jgi:hypothetical protein